MSNNITNIVKLQTKFWKNLGQSVIQWIRTDAKKGIMQTPSGESSKPHYSPEYAKYKANDMRRFNDGKRLKKYLGTSISSRDTSRVNMELTGQMFKGLHVVTSDTQSVTLGYRPADAGKVIGNRDKYGRDVANVNDKNKEQIKNEILNQFKENLKTELKDVNIVVRF